MSTDYTTPSRSTRQPPPQPDHPRPGCRQPWERVEDLLRSYALNGLTRAEQEARAGVLDRMGAFNASERSLLGETGLL